MYTYICLSGGGLVDPIFLPHAKGCLVLCTNAATKHVAFLSFLRFEADRAASRLKPILNDMPALFSRFVLTNYNVDDGIAAVYRLPPTRPSDNVTWICVSIGFPCPIRPKMAFVRIHQKMTDSLPPDVTP
jgi:hypothetical protein